MKTPQATKKLKVGIFFGGKSAEHEVSLMSAKNVLDALDRKLFEPVLIGIDKTGMWHVQPDKDNLTVDANAPAVSLLPGSGGMLISTDSKLPNYQIDVAMPILHGPFGEDGTIQGLFELAGVPYIGPGVLGSAAGMDKDVMKRLLRDAGIMVADFKVFYADQAANIDAQAIFDELGTPVFVKPANMGSSVGVSRASNEKELQTACETAFRFDTKIIVERAIVGDEIECAVLGLNDTPKASVLGRIIPRQGEFYSYKAKYVDENGAVLEIPADLPKETSENARALAVKTFQTLCCDGMGRVDMFVDKSGDIYVNEINTIPGFTKISMYPKLWEISDLPYSELITKLIHLAIERHKRRSGLQALPA